MKKSPFRAGTFNFQKKTYNANMPTGSLELLIKHLMETGVLKTQAIIDAFKSVDRIKFAPEEMKAFVYVDEALSIFGGQTISQPYTVAFMLELLEPKPGEKILDVGAGSGWQTSLLAHIVSHDNDKGRIIAIEIIPELCKFAEKNIAKFGFLEKDVVKFICGDASSGYSEEAPYDKVIAAAALKNEIPQAWKDQLKIGGRMVAPIKDSIWLFIKKDKDNFEAIEYSGFNFVPFVSAPQSK